MLYKLRIDRKYLAFLLLLLASFHFSYNRFDIMLCFLSFISLYLLYNKHYKFSAFALVIGFFMKWYLILLLPVFLVYYYSRYKKVNWSMIAVFVLTSLIIITSTILWTGVEGFLVPYKMQFGRGMDQVSMLMITYNILLGVINKIWNYGCGNIQYALQRLYIKGGISASACGNTSMSN